MNDENKSKYEIAAEKIGKLVDKKQLQYGDSFGKSNRILNVLYPDGVKPDQYPTLLTVTRIIDKLFRVANGDQGNESAFQDIAGYALLEVARLPEEKATIACNKFDSVPVTLTFETPTLMMTYNDENGDLKMETIRDFRGSISVLMDVENDVNVDDEEDEKNPIEDYIFVTSDTADHRPISREPFWATCGLKDPRDADGGYVSNEGVASLLPAAGESKIDIEFQLPNLTGHVKEEIIQIAKKAISEELTKRIRAGPIRWL